MHISGPSEDTYRRTPSCDITPQRSPFGKHLNSQVKKPATVDTELVASTIFRSSNKYHPLSKRHRTSYHYPRPTLFQTRTIYTHSQDQERSHYLATVRKLLNQSKLLKNSTNPFDIICLNETFCGISTSDNELNLPDYSIVRGDRNRHGGGVAMYIRNNLTFSRRDDLETDYVECMDSPCSLVVYR